MAFGFGQDEARPSNLVLGLLAVSDPRFLRQSQPDSRRAVRWWSTAQSWLVQGRCDPKIRASTRIRRWLGLPKGLPKRPSLKRSSPCFHASLMQRCAGTVPECASR